MLSRLTLYSGIAVIVLAALLFVAIILAPPTAPSRATNTIATTTTVTTPSAIPFAVLLTDPVHAPAGTNAVVVTYSGVKLREAASANVSATIEINASGSANLVNLTNSTRTIAIVSVPSNTTFVSMTLNVTSANVVIGDVTHSVAVPSGGITAPIHRTGGAMAGAIMDLNPAIVQVYAQNGTASFVLAPSVVAISADSASLNATVLTIGAQSGIGAAERDSLESATARIAITGASITTGNNASSISVSVTNPGGSPATLRHVILSGYMLASLNLSVGSVIGASRTSGFPPSLCGASASCSSGVANIVYGSSLLPGNLSSAFRGVAGINTSALDNLSRDRALVLATDDELNLSISRDLHMFNASDPAWRFAQGEAAAFAARFYDTLNFAIGPCVGYYATRCTVSLPFNTSAAEGLNGYTLGPGGNVTLLFTGGIDYGTGARFADMIQNQPYSISVLGDGGALAATIVNAT